MARKRAPGGGMKPRGPHRGNSVTMIMRVAPEVREGIERLCVEKPQYGKSMAQQAQTAMRRWIKRHERPHITRIADAVAMLAEEIERQTSKGILDDTNTATTFTMAVMSLLITLLSKHEATASVAAQMAPRDPEQLQLAKIGEAAAMVVNALIERGIEWQDWPSGDFQPQKVFVKSIIGRKAKTP
jgi:hypothetical protein